MEAHPKTPTLLKTKRVGHPERQNQSLSFDVLEWYHPSPDSRSRAKIEKGCATRVGGDIGLGVAFGAEFGVVANGASGELSLFNSGTTSIGFVGPDGYVALGIAKNTPTNGALNSNGQPSYGGAIGLSRSGAQATADTFQGTFGVSLLPFTVAFQASMTNVSKTSIPYLGFLLHPPRGLCKVLTGK